MSSFSSVLLVLVMILLSVIPPLLYVVICFYACWYAIKNSPTLRTRRFAISAALDMHVLFWLIYFAKPFLARFINPHFWSLPDNYWFLPYPTKMLLFNHLPIFFVFAAFVVYIVLRWRQLLYEDKIGLLHNSPPVEGGHFAQQNDGVVCQKTETTPPLRGTPPKEGNCSAEYHTLQDDSQTEPSLLAKTLNTEITFVRNLVSNYRNACLTAQGICIKRNIVLGLVVLFCVYDIVKQSLMWVKVLSSAPYSTWQFVGACALIILSFLIGIAVYALFFRLISKAIGISWDESAKEQSPPKIPLSSWSESELQPEGRQKILIDCVVFLCMIPLMLILMILGGGLVQELAFSDPWYKTYSLPQNLGTDRLFMLLVVLVVLTVLWGSYNPTKRLLGFARLFLVGGLLAFCFIEWQPLTNLIANFDGSMFGLSRWETFSKIFFTWHLTAGAFLAYSLLAAGFCSLLRAEER